MARTISPTLKANFVAPTLKPAFLAKLEFDTSTLYLSSLPFDLAWDSQTWLGNGMLHSIDGLSEDTDLATTSCTIRLASLSSALMSLILAHTNQVKKGYLYLGALNDNYEIIVDPLLIFAGFFENARFNESAQNTLVELEYENDLVKLNRPLEVRYTDQVQQALFPGDIGFQYVSAAEDWNGFWGTAPKVKRIRKRKLSSGRK